MPNFTQSTDKDEEEPAIEKCISTCVVVMHSVLGMWEACQG